MRKQLFLLVTLFSCLAACNTQDQAQQEQTHTEEKLINSVNVNHDVAQPVEVIEETISLPGKNETNAVFYLPVVKGNIEAAALKKINEQLSVKNLTDESIADIQTTFTECNCGTVGSSYEVNYNKNSILDITVFIETVGAYASGYARRLAFNTATGEKLAINQLLKPESLPELAAQCNRQLQKRIKVTLQETASGEEGEWVKELLQNKKFAVEHLQHFTVSEYGISFYYPFGFPQAALGLEPDNAFHFSFEELKGYLNPGGLLANRY